MSLIRPVFPIIQQSPSAIIVPVTQTTFWAIGDTHLSFAKRRDLTRFGEKWRNHVERIAESWRTQVKPDDVVLILGDLSWATTANRVRPDLAWLAALPGRKVLVRGNHDRWWVDIEAVRHQLLPENCYALQGDSMVVDGVLLCGAQGHVAPEDPYYKPDPPQNRYERELRMLQSALASALEVRRPAQPMMVLMHYPPFTSEGKPTAYSRLIEQYAPAQCLYAHLHRPSEWEAAVQGERNGIYYRLISSDYVDMTLQKVWPSENGHAQSDSI